MNYLAHAVLSFGNAELLTGNMISDFVKGKNKFTFPLAIQNGIQLHRIIDTYTDNHSSTREAMSFFRKDYRLYSGPIIDILFDHFLAIDETEFRNAGELQMFSFSTYQLLEENKEFWPVIFSTLFPFMKNENWLYNYRLASGIQKSLAGLSHRALYMGSSERAYQLFLEHYSELQSCYRIFFPQLRKYSSDALCNFKAD